MQNPNKAIELQVAADALQMVHQHTPVAHLQSQELAVIVGRGVDDLPFRDAQRLSRCDQGGCRGSQAKTGEKLSNGDLLSSFSAKAAAATTAKDPHLARETGLL